MLRFNYICKSKAFEFNRGGQCPALQCVPSGEREIILPIFGPCEGATASPQRPPLPRRPQVGRKKYSGPSHKLMEQPGRIPDVRIFAPHPQMGVWVAVGIVGAANLRAVYLFFWISWSPYISTCLACRANVQLYMYLLLSLHELGSYFHAWHRDLAGAAADVTMYTQKGEACRPLSSFGLHSKPMPRSCSHVVRASRMPLR